MNKLKAIVVGVSEYRSTSINDLPFCINDIELFTDTLEQALKMNRENIFVCGHSGEVTKDYFIKCLQRFIATLDESDTLIFYFSGHGTTYEKEHYLVLSDYMISTGEIIKYLEKNLVRTKIVFLDCCESGGFSIERAPFF